MTIPVSYYAASTSTPPASHAPDLLIGFAGVTGLLTSTDTGAIWKTGPAVAAAALAVTGTGVWAANQLFQWRLRGGRRGITVDPDRAPCTARQGWGWSSLADMPRVLTGGCAFPRSLRVFECARTHGTQMRQI